MDCLCRPSRIMPVRIVLLDDTDFIYELKDDLPGQALLDVVYARLNLIETTYFGIRYIDEENQTHWLDPASRISRQLKPKSDPFDLYFGVKFYAADPCKLLEEITRYQIFLQVKQDVLQGRLPVSFELAAELGAFVVQSELGDYDPRRHSKGYVSEFRLLPNQTGELETRVSELHQQLKGMSPATAEINYLDKVKWHDMYGVDLHPVLGEDSVEYFLGLTPSGIVVLRNKTTVAHYYWPRIAKVYYKGRYFMLRICDKNNELSTYGFETPRKSACKHLWRCCVEHHAFFRLVRVAPIQSSSQSSELFTLGSRFRYSGRTEKQAAKDALSIGRAPPPFTRMPSKRQPRRVMDDFLSGIGGGAGGIGGSCGNGIGGGGGGSGKNGESYVGKTQEIKSISILQPVQTYESPYRSTYSIPTSLGIRPYSNNNNNNNNHNNPTITPDSPRSTRSAPWPRSQQRNLFGNSSSPRSVRSASTTRHSTHVPTHNSSSHHSHSHHRYRSSSVESHSSNDSHSTRRHKHRHRRTSDNESELSRGSGKSGRSHHSHRKHRRSRHRRNSGGSENDSSRGRSYSGHRLSASGSAGELIDSTSQWREVQRRQADGLGQSSVQQASVSKSSMVARSLHSNDSHSDTHSHHKSRRHKKNKSPSDSRNRIWSSELAKHLQFDLVDTAGMTEDQLREIPYTVVETNHSKRTGSGNLKIHKSNSSGNTTSNGGQSNRNRVDRIRGMMSSMSMGDFISPTGSSLSPLDNSALRVSHEHTDSGLGADQDYAYSSERSSDSTRYGTNKSSGASSGSHGRPREGSTAFPSMMHHQSVSNNRKSSIYSSNRQQQQQQQQTSQHNQQQSYKYTSPAPIHNSTSSSTNNNSSSSSFPTNNNNNSNSSSNLNSKKVTAVNNKPIATSSSTTAPLTAQQVANNNRLLNYTTFENNHYKFSLNNPNAGDGYCLDPYNRPMSSASGGYYPGGGVRVSRGTGAKSDIGVPTRRPSKKLMAGNNPGAGYPHNGLHRGKSDLFLSYVHSSGRSDYNSGLGSGRLSDAWHQGSHQQQSVSASSSQQQAAAYHISGVQTSDFVSPVMYDQFSPANRSRSNRQATANDVVYYQFDNKLMSPKDSGPSVGPLVYIENSQQMAAYRTNATAMENKTQNSPCSNEGLMEFTQNQNQNQMSSLQHQHNHNNSNTNTNTNTTNTALTTSSVVDHNINTQNKSSSLEIILTPIIQSSRRVQ
ncbi:probable cyclin-dependent serine/threonine-protein kinase DDB_G0292550 isoform X3 [Episyrphus balteatus]|uniref:probable cyclin-dependent serine/threonine-protein kinase DDB_G0292550 isoform X3 n=1 Tax=Episyrphus balteatus TaxID=286459 RepID=UPI002486511E|nr:probable cyclin-dependent serine/threonine-protein kinase DDB_G0292550 isoform X3 [Episyrphus balteatus]